MGVKVGLRIGRGRYWGYGVGQEAYRENGKEG